MAKDATFDIVSQVDLQEVDNAINQSQKEISTRYDFKGSKAEIRRESTSIRLLAEDDMRLNSLIDVLKTKLIRRNVPIENLDYGKIETSNGKVKQDINIKIGIDKELAKKIIKEIKETKIKIQTQIMDDKIRVSGKKIDDLQLVISLLKEKNFGCSLQFENFRS